MSFPACCNRAVRFLVSGDFLLLFDKLIEIRIAEIAPLGRAGAKILVVERIGIGKRASANVVKWQLSAIDPVVTPKYAPIPGKPAPL